MLINTTLKILKIEEKMINDTNLFSIANVMEIFAHSADIKYGMEAQHFYKVTFFNF